MSLKLSSELKILFCRYDDIIAAMKTSHYRKIKRKHLADQENKLRYLEIQPPLSCDPVRVYIASYYRHYYTQHMYYVLCRFLANYGDEEMPGD